MAPGLGRAIPSSAKKMERHAKPEGNARMRLSG
jgi:hypothetical protein